MNMRERCERAEAYRKNGATAPRRYWRHSQM